MAAKRAVIFDLDGTLLDTLDDIRDSMNSVLTDLGFPTHDAARYRRMVGNGMRRLAELALPDSERNDHAVDALAAAVNELMVAQPAAKTRVYPEVPEVLTALAAGGVPFAILTNKPADMAQAVVRKILGKWSFAAVRGQSPDFPRKPDPQGALALAALMGVAPGRVAFLGDSDVDMYTAGAAAMRAVGAAWGFRGAAELRAAGADAVISSPMELLDLLSVGWPASGEAGSI